mmetsp:Transcript_118283/g.228293  ORF Transcript_118283/g.228293 Transcript_118283/m.228293 type:complete len:607 (-) Transcript_118283:61-1881(-)
MSHFEPWAAAHGWDARRQTGHSSPRRMASLAAELLATPPSPDPAASVSVLAGVTQPQVITERAGLQHVWQPLELTTQDIFDHQASLDCAPSWLCRHEATADSRPPKAASTRALASFHAAVAKVADTPFHAAVAKVAEVGADHVSEAERTPSAGARGILAEASPSVYSVHSSSESRQSVRSCARSADNDVTIDYIDRCNASGHGSGTGLVTKKALPRYPGCASSDLPVPSRSVGSFAASLDDADTKSTVKYFDDSMPGAITERRSLLKSLEGLTSRGPATDIAKAHEAKDGNNDSTIEYVAECEMLPGKTPSPVFHGTEDTCNIEKEVALAFASITRTLSSLQKTGSRQVGDAHSATDGKETWEHTKAADRLVDRNARRHLQHVSLQALDLAGDDSTIPYQGCSDPLEVFLDPLAEADATLPYQPIPAANKSNGIPATIKPEHRVSHDVHCSNYNGTEPYYAKIIPEKVARPLRKFGAECSKAVSSSRDTNKELTNVLHPAMSTSYACGSTETACGRFGISDVQDKEWLIPVKRRRLEEGASTTPAASDAAVARSVARLACTMERKASSSMRSPAPLSQNSTRQLTLAEAWASSSNVRRPFLHDPMV